MGEVGFLASPEAAFLRSLGVSPVADVGVSVVVEAILPAILWDMRPTAEFPCREDSE